VHVVGKNVIVSNNYILNNNDNAITVANDGSSSINSLTGNYVDPMDQGGSNDIIARSSYSQKPVLYATANNNADIDRIYQQKAYAQLLPQDTGNNSDGSIPLQGVDFAQLIGVDSNNDVFYVSRGAFLQITTTAIEVNTNFSKGFFEVYNDDTDSRVSRTDIYSVDDSPTSTFVTTPTAIQVRLQPNTNYKLHVFDTDGSTAVDLSHHPNRPISIIDLE